VSVVIDANALVAFVTNEEAAETVGVMLRAWSAGDTQLHSPMLARYEIINAFVKKAAKGTLSDDALDEAWTVIDELPISYHALGDAPSVARIALTLERRSAYDAAYLALAEELDAELWTLDGPLARNAKSHGYPVHLIEPAVATEPSPTSKDSETARS
jgi:predicted nucleic acid-binding protein